MTDKCLHVLLPCLTTWMHIFCSTITILSDSENFHAWTFTREDMIDEHITMVGTSYELHITTQLQQAHSNHELDSLLAYLVSHLSKEWCLNVQQIFAQIKRLCTSFHCHANQRLACVIYNLTFSRHVPITGYRLGNTSPSHNPGTSLSHLCTGTPICVLSRYQFAAYISIEQFE